MPANKYALLRYRVIDRCLRDKGRLYPSREDLREACEEALYGAGASAISLSTIDKDIWAMKNEGELGYHAPIEFSRFERGYYYSDPNYSINEVSLAEDDLEAIRFAAAILDQFRSVPILQQYENAIEKIINRIKISPNPQDDQLHRYIQFEKSTVSEGNDYLGPLLDAIRHHKTMRMTYQKFSDDQRKEYEIQPYLLKEYDNRWYVIAKEVNKHTFKTYGLERIQSLVAGERSFVPDPDFSASRFFQHSIGITEIAEAPVKIELRFRHTAGKYVISQPIHASQTTLKSSKEYIVIGLHVLLTQELFNLILQYGDQVEVLKPAKLRGMIAERLKGALEKYV
jgi:predicted DNA-binding transcriptional regulator YafY